MAAELIDLQVDDQGRVTIPDETRREHGIKPGDRIQVLVPPKVTVSMPRNPTSFLDYIGILPSLPEYADDEDMTRQNRDATEEAFLRRQNRQ